MTERKRNSWSTSGNDGIDSTDQYIGTNDAVDFLVKTDNTERAKFLGIGGLELTGEVGINIGPVAKHSLLIHDPSSFESGTSYVSIDSEGTAKIQERDVDDNGLVGYLLNIVTEDTPIDVTSPGFALLKLNATNEQDVNTSIGNVPILGFDIVVTNNGNMQGQPGAGWSDIGGIAKVIQNGTDQETSDFSFHSARGIGSEVINNMQIVSGNAFVVQTGADFLVDMTNMLPGPALVANQTAVSGRCFGTLSGTIGGSTSTAGFFSASGGKTNIGINVIGDYSQFTGNLGIGIVPTVQLHVDTNTANTEAIIRLENTGGDFDIFRTDATPEGSITGSVGDLAINSADGLIHIKHTGAATNTGWVRIPANVFKSFTFVARDAATGLSYSGGFYDVSSVDANLTQASLTVTLGTANNPYGAHVFAVAGGAGLTDGSDLILTVTGTSITDGGTRTTSDSEIVVATATSASTDDYFETSKKWIGQVVYTLSSTAGTAFSFDFNYGFAKYDDFGNRDFIITDFEAVGLGNKNDSGFNVELLHHQTTGWTYAATGFVPGSGAIVDMNSLYSTEQDIVNGEDFAVKRTGLTELINGANGEGALIRITTGVANSVSYMNSHIGAILK